MIEAELRMAIIEYCDDLGLFVFHSTDSRRDVGTGFPDLVIAGLGGVLFAELKIGSRRPSPAQKLWLRILRLAGQNVVLWRLRDWEDGTIQKRLLQLAAPPPGYVSRP